MSEQITGTGHIERDLDQTRARLGSHLNELQDRLSPGQVLDDLMGYFRGSEGAEFGRSLLDSVRGNPLPAAITTVGLAWLMASNPRNGSALTGTRKSVDRMPIYGHDDHVATMARLNRVQQSFEQHPGEAEDVYAARLATSRGQALGLAKHSDESADSFSDRVRHMIGSVQEAMAAKAHDLRDQAGDAVGTAKSALSSAGASAQGALQDAASYAGGALSAGNRSAGQAGGNLVAAILESPVILGALGLAAGALLGALLPHSEQEGAALGGVAAQARDAVQGLAKEGMERGGRIVQAVTDTVRDSADQQGLTGGKSPGEFVDAALSGDLAGRVKQASSDVLQKGEEVIRKEGLSQPME